MEPLLLRVEALRKVFNRRTVFSGISFELPHGHAIAVTGRNGSGKSTLAKIVAGVLSATSGSVSMDAGGREIPPERRHEYVGFISPYLQLYDEFSAEENLRLCAMLRGLPYDAGRATELLEIVGLLGRKNDQVRTYSSGMKQRLKYAFALLHSPALLILDEPSANLDADGISMARTVMDEQRKNGILIIATNDSQDLDHADTVLSLENARGQ